MKLVTIIRGINVYYSNEETFGKYYSDHIVLGSLFNKLKKDTQSYLLNSLVCGVECVNTGITNDCLINSTIDKYMINHSYSIESIIRNIKILHSTLKEYKVRDDQSDELILLSDRYIELHRILKYAA